MNLEKHPEIWKREFGFFFRYRESEMRMVRYESFTNHSELRNYIEKYNPADCFVSVAYYGISISPKGWEGADLFFDLDSDNLHRARADAETVYEVLLDDFGLKEVQMTFSGNKGYHVLVFDKELHPLGSMERREIVDYMREKYGVSTIDAGASCDIRRLRRIVGTKNSKSGKFCSTVKYISGNSMSGSSRRGEVMNEGG